MKANVLGASRADVERTVIERHDARQTNTGATAGAAAAQAGRPTPLTSAASALAVLLEERRKLLRLHYAGKIDEEQFGEEQERLAVQIDAVRAVDEQAIADSERASEIAERFEQIAAYLADLDIETTWRAATEDEQRALIDELIEGVQVHEDHLAVIVRGAPKLNVTLAEVGLGGKVKNERVGGGT